MFGIIEKIIYSSFSIIMHHKSFLFIIAMVLVFGGFAYWSNESKNDSKSGDVSQVPDAVPTQIVHLKDGARYELRAGYVMKDIAGNGKKIKMLAYNGMIPGPDFRATEGSSATIHFVNNTDMLTLLHPHGLRLDYRSDGSQLVQKEMQPGETFDYQLAFPDPGIFWYHPHVREDIQQPMGLYGTFVVTPKDPAYWGKADREETLVLGDVFLEKGDIAPFSKKYVTHALMGRFGNTQLVNGQLKPTLSGTTGEVRRLYILNTASVRPFNFTITGGAKMKLVGGDNGKYEKETFVDGVVIAPSERMIVDVYFPNAGKYAMENNTPGKVYPLGQFEISGEPTSKANQTFPILRADMEWGAQFRDGRKYLAKEPDQKIRFTVDVDMNKIMSQMGGGNMSGGHHSGTPASGTEGSATPIEWDDTMGDMNTFSTSDTTKWIIRDELTGKENMDILWKLKKGAMTKVRITNDNDSAHPMQHPFHVHGNRFLVLATNGVPNDNMVWKDTTQLKAGEVVDILIEATNPGTWMAHCHISEHLHSGMMMGYDVE